MQIKFQTKEESNKEQRESFLKLSGSERVISFLNLSTKILKTFPVKNKINKTEGNFIIDFSSKK